jgi:hypothetical protein
VQEVFFSFPTLPASSAAGTEQHSELRGYGTLGFDAYCLIDSAMDRLKGVGSFEKYRLMEAIRDAAENSNATMNTKQSYKFDADGENERATFSVTEVRHGLLP